MSDRATYAERFVAQGLAGPPLADPVAVAGRLLAVQGQDPRGFRLAVRARTEGLSAADVERELSEERSLVVSWLNRGTLHLVRGEDYPLLQALTAPPLFASCARRLRQEGIGEAEAERALRTIERAIADEGPLSRHRLRERLDRADVRTEGQALVHLLFLAAVRGLVVRGPMLGKEHAYALVSEWLGEPRSVDRAVALTELARRYLAGHGPASDRDLARWAGLPLRDARAGLAAIASELEDAGGGLVRLGGRRAQREIPPPRLLGAFDPVLLGWASREQIVGRHVGLVTNNGIFRPFALVDGRAVARWGLVRGKVTIDPLQRVTAKASAALEADAADVTRFLAPA